MAQGHVRGNAAAEVTTSLWMAQVDVLPDAQPLSASIETDVVVVGSGIAGLSAA
jgi:heterodisulfide reductase subunit A-like polyferredoxin